MNNTHRLFSAGIGVALAGALLSGCATNGASQIPSGKTANLSSNALQLAVGTATIGQDGTVGLNVVATLRQANGLTGVLANQPTLTGPFTVPAGAPGAYSSSKYGPNVDAGKGQISGSPQEPRNNQNLVNSTLGTFTGVMSYGFGPYNSDQTTTSIGAYYPGNPNNSTGNGFTYSNWDGSSYIYNNSSSPGDVAQVQPFFGTGFDYLNGPPAVPFFQDGTYPAGFAGYSTGFTTFEIPPVSGQYSLSVLAAAANVAPVTYTATASLNAGMVLGPITVAVDTATGGGLTGHVVIPAGVTETGVYVVDVHTDPASGSTTQNFYTVGPISGTGTVSWTLPGNLGPCVGSGCQNGSNATPSVQSKDTYFVAAVGYDYPAFEAAPPGNKQQKPTIANASGQADVTLSSYLTNTY